MFKTEGERREHKTRRIPRKLRRRNKSAYKKAGGGGKWGLGEEQKSASLLFSDKPRIFPRHRSTALPQPTCLSIPLPSPPHNKTQSTKDAENVTQWTSALP